MLRNFKYRVHESITSRENEILSSNASARAGQFNEMAQRTRNRGIPACWAKICHLPLTRTLHRCRSFVGGVDKLARKNETQSVYEIVQLAPRHFSLNIALKYRTFQSCFGLSAVTSNRTSCGPVNAYVTQRQDAYPTELPLDRYCCRIGRHEKRFRQLFCSSCTASIHVHRNLRSSASVEMVPNFRKSCSFGKMSGRLTWLLLQASQFDALSVARTRQAGAAGRYRRLSFRS